MLKRICFVTSSWSRDHKLGGVGIYRCLLPAKALSIAGHKVYIVPDMSQDRKTGELYGRGFEGQEVGDLDIIIHASAMSQDWASAIEPAKAHGQIIVADCDDWILGTSAQNVAFQHIRGPERNFGHWLKAVRLSDAIIFSTPYLADMVTKRLDSRSHKSAVIRNAIDLALPWKQRVQGERASFGWAGQTIFRPGDVSKLRGILGPFEEESGCEIVHVGHRPDHLSFASLARCPARTVSACSYEDYVGSLDFDVGLVPLEGTKFNQAKSWLKRLEYGACSIPSISDDTDEQRAFAGWGICKGPQDWLQALKLAQDSVWRDEHAMLARHMAERQALTVRGPDWVQFIAHLQ